MILAGEECYPIYAIKSGEATPVEICIQLAQPKSGRSQTDVSERVPGAGPETEPGII